MMTVPEGERKEKAISFRIDARIVDELQRVAKENDRSVSAEVRQALRNHLRDYAVRQAA